MNNSGKQQSYTDRDVDDQQQTNENLSPVSTAAGDDSSASVSGESLTRRNGNDIGFAGRLTDLFVGDGDLLVQRNTEEGTVMQWLQSLDMQVMGACRADERLKPLLKLNNASSVAEDRLLLRLSKHFEPSEVGLLARCLCIPLVSVRVGKINKQGTLLVPTSTRGNLVLSLLPTSDLRISFLADDGYAERLSILRNVSDCSSVTIKGIPADASGRSFAITVPNREHPCYFWCSEKSKLLGNELLEKMKNLLERKPSLAELTGISDSRLQHFVHHLETYLVGSNTPDEVGQTSQSPSLSSKPSRARTCSIQGVLNPRPNSFKLRRRTEAGRVSCVEIFENRKLPESSTEKEKDKLPDTSTEKEKLPESSVSFSLPSVDMPALNSAPPVSSLFSPYYVWCPPSSTPEFTLPPLSSPYYCWCPPVIPASTSEFTLPPLSSLLAATTSTPNLSEIPPFLPFSMSTSSQQIPMFTPLMCDPIVHIPVINICSSGQAYLVSGGGPAMNVSIPPLHNHNSPLVQETELEKNARDTLRLLISGSSQFPSVLTNTDSNANAIANSIAAMSLVSPGVIMCIEQGDLDTGGTCLNEDGGSSEEGRE